MIKIDQYVDLASAILEGDVILYFYADWCGDCQYLAPSLPELEMDFPNYKWLAIDQTLMPDLFDKLEVEGIPSFLILQNGKEISRLVNRNRKTKEDVSRFIKETEKRG